MNIGRIGLAGLTFGQSELLGEDTMSKVPILGPLGGYESDEYKALIKKQRQMAEEAKKRQAEMQQQRMNALGQQMLAFNPQNQMMAQMFGPEAAFSPQQFANMSRDPGARSRDDFSAAHKRAMATGDRSMERQGWSTADIRRMEEDEKRRRMIEQNMSPVGPGPAPIQMAKPQAGRRF